MNLYKWIFFKEMIKSKKKEAELERVFCVWNEVICQCFWNARKERGGKAKYSDIKCWNHVCTFLVGCFVFHPLAILAKYTGGLATAKQPQSMNKIRFHCELERVHSILEDSHNWLWWNLILWRWSLFHSVSFSQAIHFCTRVIKSIHLYSMP